MAESVDVISCEGLVGIGRGSGGGGRDAQEQKWREVADEPALSVV